MATPDDATPPPAAPRGLRARWTSRLGRLRAAAYAHRVTRLAYRAAVAVVGVAVVAVGVVLLPLPGPGWVVIFLGLGLLATEFAWARRLVELARRLLARGTARVRRGSRTRVLTGVVVLAGLAAGASAYVAVRGLPDWVPLV